MKVRMGLEDESEVSADLDYIEWKLMFSSGKYKERAVMWLAVEKEDGTTAKRIDFQRRA